VSLNGSLAEQMAAWSPRKRRLFSPDDVQGAFDRLRESGLLVDH
jgi:hypothetical protein